MLTVAEHFPKDGNMKVTIKEAHNSMGREGVNRFSVFSKFAHVTLIIIL